MKINFVLPEKITDDSRFGMNFSDMTGAELDQVRILFKTILDYGQFDNPLNLSKQLNFVEVIMKKLKNSQNKS